MTKGEMVELSSETCGDLLPGDVVVIAASQQFPISIIWATPMRTCANPTPNPAAVWKCLYVCDGGVFVNEVPRYLVDRVWRGGSTSTAPVV